jgi:elongation factor G
MKLLLLMMTLWKSFLEGEEPTEEEIHKCIRNGVNSLELTPVFMGSAFKNKGVQPLIECSC